MGQSAPHFDYAQAFERNLGWLTSNEQETLRRSCVAIAGLGGAGGFQAQALARLGVGAFKLADPDTFELTNFNRQIGASVETLGHSKVEVVRDMILAVNPEAKVELFSEGLKVDNTARFLEGASLVIDGIDFFALPAKLLLFEKARAQKLITITSCPLGFGASLLTFTPGGMTFEEYFDLKPGMSEDDKRFALAFGLSPAPLCLEYMSEKASRLDTGRASSVCPGLMLVGALTAAEAVKALTGKGRLAAAPRVFQVDLLTQRSVRRYYAGGMKSPWMRLKKWIVVKFLLPGKKPSTPQGAAPCCAAS